MLTLPPQSSIILLKAYLYLFLLHSTSCLVIKNKIKAHQKVKENKLKTQDQHNKHDEQTHNKEILQE